MAVRLTTVNAEALHGDGLPTMRLTTLSAEASLVGSPTLRLTALAIEVLVPVRGAPDSSGAITRQRLVLPGALVA